MPHLITTSGINWHYEVSGQGEPLVFIHGFGGSLRWWDNQVASFEKDFHVLRLDLPGHGESSWKPSTLLSMARDIKQILEDQHMMRVNLVASSFGGLIALELFRLMHEDVSRISFVGSLPKFARSASYPAGLDIDKIRKLNSQFDRDYVVVLDMFFRSLFTLKERESKAFEKVKEIRQSEKVPHEEALKSFLDILEKTDSRDRLSATVCPVQFITGTEDYICPKEAMEWVQEHMLNARLDFIEGCGHLPFLTEVEQYNDLLENFLIN